MGKKYPFKTKPYDHQMAALKTALSLKKCALLMEPRTGKTKVAIDYLSALSLAGRLDRAVIVAPARVLDVWIEEFHTHCPVNYHITVWDAKARKATLPPPNPAYRLSIVLVNYEAFAYGGKMLESGRRSKRTGRFKNREVLLRWVDDKPAAMILDESHKIKSSSSRSSVMIVSMREQFDYRLILTGTPVTKAKRVFDIYMQWKFLNPERFAEWPTSDEFKREFGLWTERNGYPQLLRAKNLNKLNSRIYKDSYRVTRAECFDLPPRTTHIHYVTLGRRTGEVYDELAREMVARIEHEDAEKLVEASIPLVLTLRLTQITGGFATTPEKEVIPLGREKLDALQGYLEEHIENDEKVVVCARFRAEMDQIERLCDKLDLPCYSIRGGLSRADVTANIRQFKDADGAAVALMNPQAGGVGIDLSSASHMIWYSLTPSWVNYTQACDRIALSKNATTYTYILAKNTVDTLLYNVLQDDGSIAEEVLRDPRKVLRNG